MSDHEWLSTSAAATALGVSYDRVYRLIAKGRYEPHRVGARYRIPREDLGILKTLLQRDWKKYPKKYGLYGKPA